jgi:predicted nuclease of predicted toxin-antitoxin system
MLRLASDEDVHGAIVKGLLRREPTLDLVRVQDVGLRNTPDSTILEWAAAEERILITADRNTMVGLALARVKAGQPMAGVLALREDAAPGQTIGDILLIAECCSADEMNQQIKYIPL